MFTHSINLFDGSGRHQSFNNTVRRRGLAASLLVASAALAGVAGLPLLDVGTVSVARAQTAVDAVTPYYAVVTRDGTPLQCRLGSASYSVKSLKAGDVIRIDGHSGSGWAQAEYPSGIPAFVKIEEASAIENGKAVKLTKNSRLMAANIDGGVNWWYLLEKELPAGTTFSVQSVVKGSDGKDTGYLVPAPKGSRGFLRRDAVRQATQSEIDAWQKAAGPGTAPAPNNKPEAKPEVKPEVKPVLPEPPKPIQPPDGPAIVVPKPAESTTTPPVTPPVPDPVGTPSGQPLTPTVPVVNPPEGMKPAETPPVTPAPVTPPVVAPTEATPPVAVPAKPKIDVEGLTSLYMTAMTKNEGEMEMGAVIGEYDKALATIEPAPDTARLRKQLQARRDALKLRSDLQETLRASDQRLAALRDKSRSADEQISKFERERQFAVVGRLAASTVYDGTKLPLMYRVTSTDPIAPRTLAYVVPTPTIVLGNLIGEMVGVAGDKKYDEQLKVNVITPSRAEVVTVPAVDLPVAPAVPPAGATPGTTPGAAPSTLTPEGIRTEVPIKQIDK